MKRTIERQRRVMPAPPARLQLGIPTHPGQDLVDWIRWTREHEFDFVELFMESPACSLEVWDKPDKIKILRRVLRGFPCLGHLPPCLPPGSPFPEVRRAVAAVAARYARFFAAIDCPAMTVHADWASSMVGQGEQIEWQCDALRQAVRAAKRHGVTVLFEMILNKADTPANCAAIIAGVPGLKFMLDVGHGNLHGRAAEQYLRPELFSNLYHLHLHDNDGDRDRHWPIASGKGRNGTVDWRVVLGELKRLKYRGTATLEFHDCGRRAFLTARRWLQTLWARV